jgi:long-chain fatty acid transport protein
VRAYKLFPISLQCHCHWRYLGQALALLGVALPACAGNGLNLIGFGGESSLMAGADVALARDTSAINTNPAGLTQLSAPRLDLLLGVAHALDIAHADSFGNDQSISNRNVGIAEFGYAKPVAACGCTVGLGLFAQGGAGDVYKNLATAFGTRDDLSSMIRMARLSFAVAWRPTDRLSLGVSLGLLYADAQQKIFPDTSVLDPADASHDFFGSELNNARALRPAARIGVMLRANDALTFGAAFAPKVALPLNDGRLTVNMSALGLGNVTYHDARLDGIAESREVSVGFALRPTQDWLLSFKTEWLDWSDALRATTQTASNPDNPAAPAQLVASTTLDWRDQYVFAFGTAYTLNPHITLYAGWNYGRDPIPQEHLNPLLAATATNHVTLGLGVHGVHGWHWSGGLEYQSPQHVRYTNPELPFGPDAEERTSYLALNLVLSRDL